MGKASSSKKIKKVQQAGVSRTPGQRRNLGYPMLIIGILAVGSVLVFFAREHSAASASEAPVANRDHWHSAFGIDICGQFQADLADAGPDTRGIHTHQDGLIHIHPYGSGASGEQATFSVFAEQVGIQLRDDGFTLPDGQSFDDGDDCEIDGDAEPGRAVLYVWPPQATDATEPTAYTENFGSVRFRADGEAWVLAFLPESADPRLPPTVTGLANPADLQAEAPLQGSEEFIGDDFVTDAPDLVDDPEAETPVEDAPEGSEPDGG